MSSRPSFAINYLKKKRINRRCPPERSEGSEFQIILSPQLVKLYGGRQPWTLDFWTLDFGRWTLDFWTLDLGMLD